MNLEMSWSEFKTHIDNKALKVQYIIIGDNYHIIAFDGHFSLYCILSANEEDVDYIDFDTNYKPTANKPIEDSDDQGRQITRIAAGQKGWTYLAKFIEIETSKLNSLKCRKSDNSNCSDVTLKLFNGSNQEVTDSAYESTVVRTEIILKMPTDFEILSGHIHQITCPTSDIFVNVVGGILELGSNYTKDFVNGMNLAFMGADEAIITDGRAAKYMIKDVAGVPYQANQIKFVLFHDTGITHRIMIAIEMFRP